MIGTVAYRKLSAKILLYHAFTGDHLQGHRWGEVTASRPKNDRGWDLSPNSIELVPEGDEWTVVIQENGEEYRQSFKLKGSAESWIEGQSIRLGLDRAVDRTAGHEGDIP
ncbi:hypothetical protein J2Y63_002899 [Shinella sp. BE166]|uniref:hypothetical protein n=1 Tax=Shinella sp. BE166 TaxID=3373918 RepID=UPI003EBE11D7